MKAPAPHPHLATIGLAPQRYLNMQAGIARFDAWLSDQLVFGLAALEADPRASLEPVAARLTDDQLPSPASTLRSWISRVGMTADWAERIGEDIGYWHLLNRMALQPERLDADTFAGLYLAFGFRLAQAKLPALGREVEDDWTCVGIEEGSEQSLFFRRTHWRGSEPAHVIVQSAYNYGSPLPATQIAVGTAGRFGMLAYPGTLPTRGVLPKGAPLRENTPEMPPACAATWREQSAATEALACLQPWRRRFPVAVGPLRAEVSCDAEGAYRLLLRDSEGVAAPLALRGAAAKDDPSVARHARLLACAGDGPFAVFGESGRAGLRIFSVYTNGRLRAV